MVKTTLSVGKLLAKLFPKSGKVISEKLSTEEFNDFSAEAASLHGTVDDTDLNVDAAPTTAKTESITADTVETDATPVSAVGADASGATADTAEITTLKAKVQSLTDQLTAETAARTTAEQQVSTLQASVAEKDEYITRLKASVNPLGTEDASNQSGEPEGLTATDREARKRRKK